MISIKPKYAFLIKRDISTFLISFIIVPRRTPKVIFTFGSVQQE